MQPLNDDLEKKMQDAAEAVAKNIRAARRRSELLPYPKPETKEHDPVDEEGDFEDEDEDYSP